MKTAISLPDRLYEAAEKTAQDMGIPRSQLYAKALDEFLRTRKNEMLTERLNDVYRSVDDTEFSHIAAAGLESLRELTKDDAW